jgi:pimeloyl-ACP methyl ester carboxylesterase
MRDLAITTPDGRTLAVRDHGPAAGRPILVHNGTPNSRLLYEPDVSRATAAGVRLISYDRPGYGDSDRQPGHSVADCAADVRAIAAALEIERLPVWGISGGGPRALACAALLGELVPAVGVLASPAPYGAQGLDYYAGMGELNVEDSRLLHSDLDAARVKAWADRDEMLVADATQTLEILRTLLSPVDRTVLSGGLVDYLMEADRIGLAPGADGWCDDAIALESSWGFSVADIRTPVLLRHGREDRFVPFAHGEWLAARIPGVEAHLTDDDGHLSLTVRHLDHLHGWLLERV